MSINVQVTQPDNINLTITTGNAISVDLGLNGDMHNSLVGLQGGSSNQFYHLSSAQYANLTTGAVVRPSETGIFITESETGAFYPATNPSGFITGVDLSAYVTGDVVRPNETGVFITESQTGVFYPVSNPSGFITGSVVRPSETGAFYAASNPSGFITGVDLSNYATVSYTTGISGSLQNQISNLNNQTGNYVLKSQTGNFITQGQTGQFYSSNNPSGYTPTGYVTGVSGNLQDQITVLNNQTGSFYPINNPSGYITGVDLSFSGNYYTKTESESRYVNTTGAETILGDKTFHDKVYINNLYVTGLETVVSTTNTNVASNYLMLNLTGGAVDGGIFFVTGSGLTGINDSGAIIGFDHSDKFKFGIGTRASDLSVLDTIASFEDVTGISGSLQTQISTLNNATGNYVLTSESGQFYPSSNPSGFITGVDLSAYVTGDVVRPSETGAFYAASNPSGFATVVDPVRTTLTGNGSTSIYTISGASGLVNPSALIVAIDGALQEPVVDYTVASGNITFTSPLASGSKAVVISPTNTLQVSQMIPADGSVTSSKLDTNLTIAGQLQAPNQVLVDNSSIMTRGSYQDFGYKWRDWYVASNSNYGVGFNNSASNQIFNWTNNSQPSHPFYIEGDTSSLNFSNRIIKIQFTLRSGAAGITGTGSACWFVIGEQFNLAAGSIGTPNKKGFGIKLTSTGISLWVHNGTVYTLGTEYVIPSYISMFREIRLTFQNGQLTGSINGNTIPSVIGGPSGDSVSNQHVVSWQTQPLGGGSVGSILFVGTQSLTIPA